MGVVIHTKYVDNTTLMDATSLDVPFSELDDAILKLGNHSYASTESPITQAGTTVRWADAITLYHHRDSDGVVIRQTLSAGSVVVANRFAAWLVLNDTDHHTYAPGDVVTADMDLVTSDLKNRNIFVLFSRDQATGGGTGLLNYVGLKPQQPLSGSDNLTTAATSTVVSFPTGITMTADEYKVFLQGTGAGFYPRDPVVTTHGATSFTVTHTNTAGTEAFDWILVGD